MTIAGVIAALLYVSPGFVALWIYHAHCPPRRESDFARTTASVVLSLVVLAFARLLCVVDGTPVPEGQFPPTKRMVALFGIAVALGYALAAYRKLRLWLFARATPKQRRRYFFLMPELYSAFAVAAELDDQWHKVTLTNGDIYVGSRIFSAFDPNRDEFDLLLSQATRRTDEDEVLYLIDGHGVYLRSREIRSIEFWADKVYPSLIP